VALRNGSTAPTGAARFEGMNVRVTPPPVATGNPFTYPTARDQFLACYRNLQLACYGMSIDYGSDCRDITDANMRQFCYGVSYNYAPDCDSIANANTRQLCYAMATSSSSYCSSITKANDRQFCYAVSTRDSQYCASIQW
jgi:hypothetical protein